MDGTCDTQGTRKQMETMNRRENSPVSVLNDEAVCQSHEHAISTSIKHNNLESTVEIICRDSSPRQTEIGGN
jgi:hypothetical protein